MKVLFFSIFLCLGLQASLFEVDVAFRSDRREPTISTNYPGFLSGRTEIAVSSPAYHFVLPWYIQSVSGFISSNSLFLIGFNTKRIYSERECVFCILKGTNIVRAFSAKELKDLSGDRLEVPSFSNPLVSYLGILDRDSEGCVLVETFAGTVLRISPFNGKVLSRTLKYEAQVYGAWYRRLKTICGVDTVCIIGRISGDRLPDNTWILLGANNITSGQPLRGCKVTFKKDLPLMPRNDQVWAFFGKLTTYSEIDACFGERLSILE
jgi:hypothetical protein